ncbi:MAG: hypothetical protein WCX79_02260 [Candidatus Paceibacterota bacterium]|jgi:hypothetical protein
MSDLNKLRSDVNWWMKELKIRQKAVIEAMDALNARQRELTQAEREEIEIASKKPN